MSLMSRFEAVLHRPAPVRPVWQRIVLPVVGLLMVIIGLVGWIMPVLPGAPLAVLGLPWLFCFNRRSEQWIRVRIRNVWDLGQRLARRLRGQVDGRSS